MTTKDSSKSNKMFQDEIFSDKEKKAQKDSTKSQNLAALNESAFTGRSKLGNLQNGSISIGKESEVMKFDSDKNRNTSPRQKKESDEAHSDNSENSSKRFIKVRFGGERDTEPMKQWEADLNHIFKEDKSKFIGEFLTDNYKVMRGYINGAGNRLRLYYTKLEPFAKKLASLCILHGYGEHSGRFINMADYFVQKGFVVHLIDMRGFGYSGDPRANASVEELHKDIEVLLRQANRDLPLFVFGHSAGAGLVASLLIRNPYLNISGVIFSSALFQFHKSRKIPLKKKIFLKLFANDLEEFTVNAMINPTSLTSNNFEIKKLYDDHLYAPFCGLKLAKALCDLTEWTLPRASRFRYPVLILHGKEDTVTDYEASIKFYYGVSSEVKDIKIFEDGFHEIHHDTDKELFFKIINEFLQKRLQASPKNIGEFQPLKVGLKVKSIFEKYKTASWVILGLIYVFFLKQFRGHKLYNNKIKLFLYPIFYFINILLKKHSWTVD